MHRSHLFGQWQHLPQQGIHLRQLLRVASEKAQLQLRGEGRQQRDVARRVPASPNGERALMGEMGELGM